MLAQALEKTLNDLFQKARSEGADRVGAEDLLRALLGDSECRDVSAKLARLIEQRPASG